LRNKLLLIGFEQQVAAECNRWQKEGNSYQAIVTELGRILLGSDKALDADLSDFEARNEVFLRQNTYSSMR
jgi:hypothetical protein